MYNASKHHCLIGGLSILHNHHQSIKAKARRKPSRAQKSNNFQFLLERHLKRPGQWQGEDENRQIGHHTHDRVGHYDFALVEARAAAVGAVPVGRYGTAYTGFDDEGRYVLGQNNSKVDIDEDDPFAVWFENAG